MNEEKSRNSRCCDICTVCVEVTGPRHDLVVSQNRKKNFKPGNYGIFEKKEEQEILLEVLSLIETNSFPQSFKIFKTSK